VLIAPGGWHLELESVGLRVQTRLAARDASDKYAPSVDRLFSSAAKHYSGVSAVKDAGGSVLAESEETAVIFGMPQQAIRTGAVDRVLPLHEIAASIQGGDTGVGANNDRSGRLSQSAGRGSV
jgi:two-component system chemotaxis response regulator CheB